MRERIIERSLERLKEEGLRFSLDNLAKELGISKKTVYKHFPTKGDLAKAIYDKYYEDLGKIEKDDVQALLKGYCGSYLLMRDEVFNKFALNESLRSHAVLRHEKAWERLAVHIDEERREAIRTIIDGSIGKAGRNKQLRQKVTKELMRIVC